MLAIIPARGGSKRLPNKNIKLLNGRPLILYTIEAALRASLVSRVIVNTDSKDIAKIAKKNGAEVPFIRPAYLATDNVSSIDVLKHTLKWIEKHQSTRIDDFVLLQPTSPLRSSQHIDEAIELFYRKSAESVISCCEESHPIHWNKYVDDDGKLDDIFPLSDWGERIKRRKTYIPNGAIYVSKSSLLESDSLFVPQESYVYMMDRDTSIDIDTAEDFEYAEYILTKL